MSRTSSTLKRLGVGSVGVCTLLATPYLGGVANAAAPAAGTSPTISIASQTTLTGSTRNDGANSTVKISATTTPSGAGAAAIAGVRFSYQAAIGGPVVIGTDPTAPYSYEWAPPAPGTYTEIAEALDSANNVINASTKTGVVVGDVSSVRIATPAEGATVGSFGGNIVVSGTRSADLPAITVTAQTRDNSSGNLTAPGALATGTAGTGGAWSATVAAPACVNSVTAGDCNVVITAVADNAGSTSDEVTEAKLYAQTLTTFNVDPPSATKPVGASQDYLVTAQDQNAKPIVGLAVDVTDNSATASETPATGVTGPNGTFTFAGANSAVETATFTVRSKWDGATYNPAVDFSRTATLTTYASAPSALNLSADPAKSLYASQKEYTTTAAGALGTPVVNLCIVDQNGNGTPNSALPPANLVTTVTRTTTTGGTTADPVTTTVVPVQDTRTGKGNCYVIPKQAASGDSGQDVFNAYYENNGTPGYQAGSSDITAVALTLKFATLDITTTPSTQAQQGTNASVAFKVAGLDGTPFAGRKISLSATGTGATFPTTQPAGTTYTGATTATCLTDANGVCNVTVADATAGTDSVTASDDITDAALKQIATNDSATASIDFRAQPVTLTNVDQYYTDSQLIKPSWSGPLNWDTPQPGDAVQVSYQLYDANGAPLRGVSTQLTLDHGFFTPNCATTSYVTCTFSPAIADGAPVGNLKNDGKTTTVTSDSNGRVKVTIGIARDAGFDDDGWVSVSMTVAANNGTVVNGPANNNNSGNYWFNAFSTDGNNTGNDPYNGAAVKMVPNSSTDKLSGDVAVNNGTRFYVEATDQFGNLVRTSNCNGIIVTASGNGRIDWGWCSNGGTPGSFTNNRHVLILNSSTAGTFAGEPSTVTATWNAPVTTFKANTPATTPPTYTVNSTSVNKTDSFTVNLYAIDQQNLQYSFASTPGNSVPVNTAVTTSVTIKDQKGNPVRNALCIRFIRSGPDAQSGDTGDCNFSTNSEGRAGYSFSSTSPGTATISVIVTDGNGNELGRGVQNVAFTKGTPATTKPSFSLATNVISAGQTDRLVVRGTPGQTVEVLAYSLPNTTYKVVRTGTLSSAGTAVFYVAPATNSRIYVRSTAGQAASQHITVKSALTLAASAKGRVGTFTGKVSPAVVGRTVTIYYIKGGKSVAAGSAKVAKGGTYTFSRTFAAPGQKISFFAQTTKDSLNASGRSLTRQITFGR